MSDEKIDKVLEHILDLKETLARLEGANLPARVDKLEDAVHEVEKKWSKMAGIAAAAGVLSGGFIGAVLKKAGLTP